MAIKNVLHLNLTSSYNLVRSAARFLHREFLQFEEVPDTDCLIQRATSDEGILGVELGTHHIVRVACEDCELVSILPVPDANGLVVTRADDPWQLRVELHRADVVHMAGERE